MTCILALDLGKRTGFAYGATARQPVSGSVQLGKPGASHGQIASNFKAFLHGQVDMLRQVDVITFEAPLPPQAQSAMASARILYGLSWQLEQYAHAMGIKCFEATVQEIRQFFIGHGRLKSDDAEYAISRKCKMLGWSPCDHNAADALALWSYQAAIIDPRFELKRHAGVKL